MGQGRPAQRRRKPLKARRRQHVLVAFEDGIAWVTMNRPTSATASVRRWRANACRHQRARIDPRCQVLVLTALAIRFPLAWT